MNCFQYGTYWFKLPTGHIVQFGSCSTGGGDRSTWPITNYPVAFPNAIVCAPILCHSGPAAGTMTINVIADTMGSLTSFRAGNSSGIMQTASYIVIGR
ncbi:gp53-like domain-containing protein [Leminorella grimontii]|uniref:gp53-like domain-containing protein n=1 Tax=Leminorella grimontii TaxID=82981 RepID=UPI0040394347